MKYKSSLTKSIKLTILILLLFWIVNFLAIINSNGIKDALVFSIFMLCFAIIFVSAFVKGVFLVIENNRVKYVHMFILRKIVEIGQISKIQKGLMGGLYNSLSLVYKDNEKLKDIKITTLTFSKNTLKRFISDLKNKNPKIEIDQSINEFLGE